MHSCPEALLSGSLALRSRTGARVHVNARWRAPVFLSADLYLGQDLCLGASTLYFSVSAFPIGR